MGKLSDLLKGIALPPDTESQVRIFDLQHEALEKKCGVLEQENEALRMKQDDETRLLQQAEGSQEVIRYTTQKMADPNQPTDEEAIVLKFMQPPGRQLPAMYIAQPTGEDLTTTEFRLNELERKGFVHKQVFLRGYGRQAKPPQYSLTPEGVAFLVRNKLTKP